MKDGRAGDLKPGIRSRGESIARIGFAKSAVLWQSTVATMRNLTWIVAMVSWGVCAAGQEPKCSKPASAPAVVADPGPELAIRWESVGAARLAGDTNATLLHGILEAPSTENLLADVLGRLARTPERCCPALEGTPEPGPTELIRPLLEDLLRRPLLAEAWMRKAGEVGWTLAIRLEADRAAMWRTNWHALTTAFGASTVPALSRDEARDWKAVWTEAGFVSRLDCVDEWCVVSWGKAPLPHHAGVLEQLEADDTGLDPEEAWLKLEAAPRLWTWLWDRPACEDWPRARLQLKGRGANLRSNLRLTYLKPVSMNLEPWHIPTNTVREPLISFTAIQGIGTLLPGLSLVQELGLESAPNQVFGWAQSQVPFCTYFAWEMPDRTNAIRRLADTLPEMRRKYLSQLEFGEFAFQPELTRTAWRKLPILVPFVDPALGDDLDFVVAGVFPVANPRSTAPPELYAQLRGRTNLVYYDWEITQNRVNDWRTLKNYYSMLSHYAPPDANDPTQVWLTDTNVTHRLGNSVTEVTLTSPQELALVRTSAIGLTGFEIAWLMRWLGDPAFPGWSEPKSAFPQRDHPAPPPPVSEEPAATPPPASEEAPTTPPVSPPEPTEDDQEAEVEPAKSNTQGEPDAPE